MYVATMKQFNVLAAKRFGYLREILNNLSDENSEIETDDTGFVQYVIEKIKNYPDQWNASWFAGDMWLCKSIRSGNVLLMFETGEIIHPVRPRMTKAQKKLLKGLSRSIVERDRKWAQAENGKCLAEKGIGQNI
jgi:hypothetical protein